MKTLTWKVGDQSCTCTLPEKDIAWLAEQLRLKYPGVILEIK